jgi:DNA-directed RNA polymerase alpha subunit
MKEKPKVPKEAFAALSVAVDEDHSVFCLEQLGVPQRVINLLYDSGIKSVADLLSKSPEKMLAIPSFGKSQLRTVLNALSRYDTIEDL